MNVKAVDGGMLICKCVVQFNNKSEDYKGIAADLLSLYQANRSRAIIQSREVSEASAVPIIGSGCSDESRCSQHDVHLALNQS